MTEYNSISHDISCIIMCLWWFYGGTRVLLVVACVFMSVLCTTYDMSSFLGDVWPRFLSRSRLVSNNFHTYYMPSCTWGCVVSCGKMLITVFYGKWDPPVKSSGVSEQERNERKCRWVTDYAPESLKVSKIWNWRGFLEWFFTFFKYSK